MIELPLTRLLTTISVPSAGRKRGLPSDFDDRRILPEPVEPSTADYAKVHKRLGSGFQDDRSLSHEAIPLALFDPIFGQFADDVRDYQPTESENRFAINLRRSMAPYYDNEQDRIIAFRDAWRGIQDGEIIERMDITNSDYTTSGHYQIDDFCVLITQGKGELTGITSDPVLQASMCYIASLKPIREKGLYDLCPCLIIYYVGT